eukprot:GHVU01109647.1.p1 GENE.GHVU01109647.1~~GHVU01109647.1.p1  ORF type:complete len:726 (+),score=102.33 GHVU01109647.1:94-2178(+)
MPKQSSEAYTAFKTDKERLDFILKQDIVHNVLLLEPEYEDKSAEKALNAREDGNKFFKKKSYLNALDQYTRRVQYAKTPGWDYTPIKSDAGDGTPPSAESKENSTATEKADPVVEEKPAQKTSSEEEKAVIENENLLAMAYANRSAALLHLKKFELCLRDIDLALGSGYPEDSRYKLYDRQAKCHALLKNREGAEQSLKQAKENLNVSKLDDKGKLLWTKSLDKQIENCAKIPGDSVSSENTGVKKSHPPKLDGEPSEKFSAFSNLTDIRLTPNHGRGLFAEKEIRMGKVLLKEQPYATVLFPDFNVTHCHHCLTRVLAPLPCDQCAGVLFCSKECKEQAWGSYHKHECKLMALLTPEWCGKIGHLALRIVLQADSKLLKTIFDASPAEPENDPLKQGFNEIGVYGGNTYSTITSLNINSTNRKAMEIFEFGVAAVFLLKISQMTSFFKDVDIQNNVEDQVRLSEAYLKLLQIVQSNSFGVMQLDNSEKFDSDTTTAIGRALYPTLALVNHSCDPNSEVNFFGKEVIIRPSRNIKKGQEITVSYGPLFFKDPKSERREMLKKNYQFDCQCQACKEKWLQWQMLVCEYPTFKCGECDILLDMEQIKDNSSIKCKSCGYTQNIQEGLARLESSHEGYYQALQHAMAGRTDMALEGLEEHMASMQSCLTHPWKDLVSCQQAIRNCYLRRANTGAVPL